MSVHQPDVSPPEDEEDRRLLLSWREGNNISDFEKLFKKYEIPHLALASRILGCNGQEECDVVQEAWGVTIPDKYKQLKGSFKSWSCAIIHHLCLDIIRGRKRRRELGEGKDIVSPEETSNPETLLANKDQNDALWRAFAQLDEADRILLQMHAVDELTFAEIGNRLGKPLTTIQSQFYRAVIRLHNIRRSNDKEVS